MRSAAASPPSQPPAAPPDAFTQARLEELARLRRVGMASVAQIERGYAGVLDTAAMKALCGMAGLLARFLRTERAVRQIIILELELMGMRPAPDRDRPKRERSNRDCPANAAAAGQAKPRARAGRDDDRTDPSGYHSGPYDEVVSRVRRDLGVEAPANDPFAPPPERKPDAGAGQRPARSRFRLGMIDRAAIARARRKIIYAPVVTLGMVLRRGEDVAFFSPLRLKARYLAGEFGRGRGPPG